MAAPEWLDPYHVDAPAEIGAGVTGVAADNPAATTASTGHGDGAVAAAQVPEDPAAGKLFASASSPVLPTAAVSTTAPSPAVVAVPVPVVGCCESLLGACGAFFDPVVVAQLDAALAHELADRAHMRAADADDLLRNALAQGRSLVSLADLAGHAGGTKSAATKAAARAVDATTVLTALGGTVTPAGFDPDVVDHVDPGALIDVITAAETAKNALCAVQARAEVVLMAQQRLTQARAGIDANKLGQGVGAQVGLARAESPYRGRQLCELGQVLVRELPHTLDALGAGVLNEYRAGIIARETVFLTLEDRAAVDELLCADPGQLSRWGNRELAARARKAAYALEPEAFVRRLEKAETERYVSLRPAADGMTLLTALLPLRQGVRILATLTRIADTAAASGDERGKGQLMADTLIHRLTHHTPCTIDTTDPVETAGRTDGTSELVEAVARSSGGGDRLCAAVVDPDIVLELIMTDRALFDGANDPAILVGYDPIPAPTARNWILGTAKENSREPGRGGRSSPRVWLKRLFTHPDTGALLAMDSRARLFPEGMKEFLRLRDQRCATPWCDAPIRQYDHIKAYAAGGPTTVSNGQGLCIACNQTKETPGWLTQSNQPEDTGTTSGDGVAPPGTRITTPTSHHYATQPPPLLA
ncbi:MAG: DUF222 domain-containing protein [Specibacter sp.]